MKRIVVILIVSICLVGCTNAKGNLVSQLEQTNLNHEKSANEMREFEYQLSTLTSKNDHLLKINQELKNTIEDNKLTMAEMKKIIEDNKSRVEEFQDKIEGYETERVLLQNEVNNHKKESNKKEIEHEIIDGYETPIKYSRTFYAFSIEESHEEDGARVVYSYDAWEIKNEKKTIISNIRFLDQYWYREDANLPISINLDVTDPIEGYGNISLALYNGARNSINEYRCYGSVKKAILYVNSIPNAVIYFDEAMGRQEVNLDLEKDPNLQLEFKIVEVYDSFRIQEGVAISHIELSGGL